MRTLAPLPLVLARVVESLRLHLPGVEVVAGPPMQGYGDHRQAQVLYVGYAPSDEAVVSERDDGDFDGDHNERVSILCEAMAWHDDANVDRLTSNAFAILTGVEAALAADETFGGLARGGSGIGEYRFDVMPDSSTPSGIRASLPFSLVLRVM